MSGAYALDVQFWHRAFSLQYRFLALIDPLVRAWWRRFGLGNVVELRVARRRDGRTRSRLVGVLRAGGGLYVGHPSGDTGWSRDLSAAGRADLVDHRGRRTTFVASRLQSGEERDAAIGATGQHPFPANVVYRLGRRHIRAAGVYFVLSPGPGDRSL